MKSLKDGNIHTVVKSLSVTHWSAYADAAHSLLNGYHKIQVALLEIANDIVQKSETVVEAEGLASNFNLLEVTLMTIIWDKILKRFNSVDNMDIGVVVKQYDTL